MKNNTKELTFIALLLAAGIVVKGITDSFLRTFLFFLMLDPLTVVNACIFIKYPKKKYLFGLIIAETVLAATIFMATDIYFLRPLDIFITFLVCKCLTKKSVRLRYFFSTFFSLFINILLAFTVLSLIPNLGIDISKLTNLFEILKDSSLFIKIIISLFSVFIVGVWVCIPSLFNMFIGEKISKVLDKISK